MKEKNKGAHHLSERVEEALNYIEDDNKIMVDLAAKMLSADDSSLYAFDLFLCSVIKRSLSLSTGFITMIRDQNFICAAPLIRLQLDSALRVFAGFIVDNPRKFAEDVIKGEEIRNMKDRNGKQMTDWYLRNQLTSDSLRNLRANPDDFNNKKYAWVEAVYKNTSGYIHLSDKHFFNTIHPSDHSDGYIQISPKDVNISDEFYLDAISAFRASTEIIADFVHGWTFTKENPKKVAEMKAARNQ